MIVVRRSRGGMGRDCSGVVAGIFVVAVSGGGSLM